MKQSERRNNEAVRALNRFGMGARIGEAGRIDDPRAWLESQLDSGPGQDAPPPATPSEIGRSLQAVRAVVRNQDRETLQEARRSLRDLAVREVEWALVRRIDANRGFLERLVAFWSNHLCVSAAAKPLLVGPLAGLYEREAIRPHVLGRFEDMLLASARHPAMLLYLDNAQSIGPDSLAGRRSGRRGGPGRGLNENYGRELLELHTVGVDGGYTQDDVVALARILTGWSVAGVGLEQRLADAESDVPTFRFFPALHEPGAHTVLGTRYRDGGEEQGTAVIRALAGHPSTARFLATKLARHFVSDDPSTDDVASIADVFLDTGGDLGEVARAVIRLAGAWQPGFRKFRSPADWLVASLRALGLRQFPPAMAGVLSQLRQPLWSPPSPKGYGDGHADWGDPDSLMNRAELARTIAGRAARAGLDATELTGLMELPDNAALRTLLEDPGVAADERLALALGGPDFQWR